GAAERRIHRGLAHFTIPTLLVADLTDQLVPRILVAMMTEMSADAPVDVLQLVLGVALDGKAAQEHEAAAVLELVEHGREPPRKRRQRKVVMAELRPREPAPLHRAKRGIDLVDLARREGPDPVAGSRHVAPEPRLGSGDR